MPTHEEKRCRVCGRRFAWRRAWADVWDEVRHCSRRCRRQGIRPLDLELEDAMMDLARTRGRHETLCPSEVARAVRDDWKPLMERVRQAARRRAAVGENPTTVRPRFAR